MDGRQLGSYRPDPQVTGKRCRTSLIAVDHLGDRQPEYANDPWDRLPRGGSSSLKKSAPRQGLAIAQYEQIGGHVESLGVLRDAGDQHFVFVAN